MMDGEEEAFIMRSFAKVVLLLLCLALPLSALAEGAREMPEPFASAASSDPSLIPYPENRDENGYLTEGEFVYEDPEQGLWAYLSPTLQVQIVQYDGNWDKYDERWFVAEVKFDTAAESFGQHTWYLENEAGERIRGDRKNQQIWPKTLAQAERMVLAVNGDYYLNRTKEKTTGNIIRQGRVIYDFKNSSSYPNLDSAVFFADGSMAVYGASETTATDMAEQGAVDMVSFGPWLVRNGELRQYEGKNHDHREPRMAIGMVEPGHYVIVDCEGRVPDGPRGLTLNELGALLYYNGANEAINMDGGNTSVLIFMGEMLNRIGHDTYLSAPRNQEELFGVGYSEQVRTDWMNGKPNK